MLNSFCFFNDFYLEEGKIGEVAGHSHVVTACRREERHSGSHLTCTPSRRQAHYHPQTITG